MKVSTVTEEVTVRGETPVVDTKSANVSVNLDAKLLDTTPGGKDIWNILEYKVPGLVFDTPDVGGNQGGLQRAFTSRGTPNSQNVQLLNGVNVGDPAAIGFSMNYYEPSTFENIQVTTGAQDISMGTSGTLINMVTRSGTNRFGGQTLATYQGDRHAVGQHRRVPEAGRLPAGGAGGRLHLELQRPGRRPARQEQAVLLRVVQRPADARQRARLSRRSRRRQSRRR